MPWRSTECSAATELTLGSCTPQVKEFLKDPGAFIVEAAPEASGGGGGGAAAEEKKEEAKAEEEEEEEDDVRPFSLPPLSTCHASAQAALVFVLA